jgi:hypothetical protein
LAALTGRSAALAAPFATEKAMVATAYAMAILGKDILSPPRLMTNRSTSRVTVAPLLERERERPHYFSNLLKL